MNVLVTGGAGFQGSHLVEALVKQGHFVRILNTPSEHAKGNVRKYLAPLVDKGRVEVVWGSVSDRYLLDMCMKDVERVFHLGAKINVDESLQRPLDFININIKGTENVLAAAATKKADVVHASTCEVYGDNIYGTTNVLESARKYKAELEVVSSASIYGIGSKHLMDEYHPLFPASPYAASKAAGDRICYSYWKSFGLKVKIVRPFNIFGPRQKDSGFGAVVPIFFKKAIDAPKEPLKIFGDGSQTRDYLYVTDLVRAYLLIADEPALNGEAINLGSGEEISVNRIAETVNKLTGRPADLITHTEGRAGEVNSFIADTSLIEQFGFKPEISFDAGMLSYYDWKLKEMGK